MFSLVAIQLKLYVYCIGMKCIGTLSVLKQSKERTDTAAKRVRISRGYLLTVDKNQYGPKELI